MDDSDNDAVLGEVGPEVGRGGASVGETVQVKKEGKKSDFPGKKMKRNFGSETVSDAVHYGSDQTTEQMHMLTNLTAGINEKSKIEQAINVLNMYFQNGKRRCFSGQSTCLKLSQEQIDLYACRESLGSHVSGENLASTSRSHRVTSCSVHTCLETP